MHTGQQYLGTGVALVGLIVGPATAATSATATDSDQQATVMVSASPSHSISRIPRLINASRIVPRVSYVSGDRWHKGKYGTATVDLDMKQAVSVSDMRFMANCRRLVVWGRVPVPERELKPVQVDVVSQGKRASATENIFLRLPLKKGKKVRVTVTALDRTTPSPSADRTVELTFAVYRCA